MVIDLSCDAGIRAERQRQFALLQGNQQATLELQSADAAIGRLVEEFNGILDKIQQARVDRRRWESQAHKAVRAKEWLRHNLPEWVRDELSRLDSERREIDDESDQPRRRLEYIETQVELAERLGPVPRELSDKLAAAREELRPFTTRVAAINDQKAALVERCVREAWPEPPAVDEPAAAEVKHVAGRRRVSSTVESTA